MRVLLDHSVLWQEFLGRHPDYDQAQSDNHQAFRNRIHHCLDLLSQDPTYQMLLPDWQLMKLLSLMQHKGVNRTLMAEEMVYHSRNWQVVALQTDWLEGIATLFAETAADAQSPDFEHIALEVLGNRLNCQWIFTLDPRYESWFEGSPEVMFPDKIFARLSPQASE